MTGTTADVPDATRTWWQVPLHLVRGFLIGCAELVPGVSGGTVALVTGVYDALIDSASRLVEAVVRLVRGPDRRGAVRAAVDGVDGWLLGPVLVGMVAAVLTVAGVMESFVTGSPELARGLFLGLVLASIAVPLRMAHHAGPRPGDEDGRRGWTWRDGAVGVGGAVVAFLLVGLAGGGTVSDPPLILVAAAAAVAICALVVPGVSGSFFLLAIGLYSPTLAAVDSRDLAYVACFAAGAFVGLATFVRLLHWLLEHHRRTTLVLMSGLMAGSLRALWPWQGGSAAEKGAGDLVAPYDPVLGPVLLGLAGAAVVAVVAWLGARAEADGTER